jgi:hypothetical protein
MSTTADLKTQAANFSVEKGSNHEFIKKLILSDFFDIPKTSKEVTAEIRQTFGKRLESNVIQTYMKKFMGVGIIRAVRHAQHKGNYWVLASVDKARAIQLIGKDGKVQKIENQLFSDTILKPLGQNFEIEFQDLHHNFGISGICTAFLLRKILEKLIYLTFAKQGLHLKLTFKGDPNRLVGLEAMINVAVSEKIGGVPFLTPSTARQIQGIKFLGDAAAHNPLANVDMKTILPQMPFIITAFEELAKKM